MNSMEKLLQESADFLHEVGKITLRWSNDLEVEKAREIVNYHPIDSGHMLRPLLVYMTASASPENITLEKSKKLSCFAAAVELMHNASLIHDDLIDQEEVRRGRASLYKTYGFKNALLVGSLFYIKAIELSNQYLTPIQTADILKAAMAMCEGEILQAEQENKPITEDIYYQIISRKTGGLTELACRQAAAIMDFNMETIELFGKLGKELGVLYQLRDDRKDQDVYLAPQVHYKDCIEKCNQRIISYLEELSKTQKIKQFEEIITYFKKE